jgi:hypothetical protein
MVKISKLFPASCGFPRGCATSALTSGGGRSWPHQAFAPPEVPWAERAIRLDAGLSINTPLIGGHIVRKVSQGN